MKYEIKIRNKMVERNLGIEYVIPCNLGFGYVVPYNLSIGYVIPCNLGLWGPTGLCHPSL